MSQMPTDKSPRIIPIAAGYTPRAKIWLAIPTGVYRSVI